MTAPITGEQRAVLARELRHRYEAGATIRQLMDHLGRSHGCVYQLLQDAGTEMRPRGVPHGYRHTTPAKEQRR